MKEAGKKSNVINIENAKIVFRNFGGVEGKFNPEGKRNFSVILETDIAEMLADDGWNIKWLEPKDPDADRVAHIPVAVEFTNIPPRVVMITGKGSTDLNADTVGLLDMAEFASVDLIIRPYDWDVNGKTGRKAYLKTMYVTIVEDVFASKYYDVPDSATRDSDRED